MGARTDDRSVKVAAFHDCVISDDAVPQATVFDERAALDCDVSAEDAREHARTCFNSDRSVYFGPLQRGG